MAELAFLFECHFTDGTMIQQTPDDISSADPSRSQFYDVLQRLNEVQSFGIYSDLHTYAVDLRDGHFEIDGTPFTLPCDELPEGHADFRLIYFRRHTHTQTLGQETTEEDHQIAFHIGWQTTYNGRNYQRTISVK